MIVFKNKGLIDLRAVSTFGVSVKVTDNPIGYFGTGLKYALAVLLRNKQQVTIFRGRERYEFTARKDEFRDQEIDVVYMNDAPLGFTLELGKNWELWMALRELWCNAKDEGGEIYRAHVVAPEEDVTQIAVEGREFDDVYRNRGDYILTTEPEQVGTRADAHRGDGNSIFYKGIAVKKRALPAAYNYNVKDGLSLTEDRTLAYEHSARAAIMALVLQSTDARFIEKVLTRGEGSFEDLLDYTSAYDEPEQTFLDVVGKLREDSVDTDQRVNRSAVELHKQHVIRNLLPDDSTPLTTIQKKQFDKARKFVNDVLGADMTKYPIIIVDSLGPGHLGRADNGKIYVATKSFEMGTKYVAAALYEEYIHLSEQVADESYGQKICYLEKILSLGEQLVGEPL